MHESLRDRETNRLTDRKDHIAVRWGRPHKSLQLFSGYNATE